jgi:hypothetical protein
MLAMGESGPGACSGPQLINENDSYYIFCSLAWQAPDRLLPAHPGVQQLQARHACESLAFTGSDLTKGWALQR